MATRRYSLTPQASDYQVTDAVGAATVTASIELTVDWDTLITTNGLSAAQARLQVIAALKELESYLEGGLSKPNIPG